jgi:hypothetical protein
MLLNVIIFSKDRAMQLNLLLETMLSKFKIDDYKVNILYKTSNDEYDRGYNMIRDLYPQFTYKKEQSFKEDLLSLFNESKYTIFFVDDIIFYNDVILNNDELHNIFMLTEASCFSLRLGLNTRHCYTQQKLNSLENYKTHNFYYDTDLIEPVISWKVGDGTNDYAYPMSTDAHIFKTEYIKNLCEFITYTNPNTFEALLSNFSNPEMVISSYKKSKIVNSPINKVQNVFENLAGMNYGYSAEDLNEMFLDGLSFNVSKMNFTEIKGCHQEIQPFFKINEK